jgi:diaminohydroxyphosphoribosylaminopyrimidine deaminase/5-amino-6-(5-phosphoribosylamino)uracil reductase
MRRCIELAAKGTGHVAPNPMVGCVIVKDGSIIAEGYHIAFGGPHAEVNALKKVPESTALEDATLYVNLEPCSHYGKTPPCASLIVSRKLGKVVIAQRDPNPQVSGRGVQIIKDAGIEVIEGVLEAEARELNRRFLTFHEKNRPYIILKWAQSADGFMDRDRSTLNEAGVNWISHPETKKLVHKWRSEEAAILVGSRTIINDDPALTTREYAGKSPQRIVLSQSGKLPAQASILNDGRGVWIYGTKEEKASNEVEWIRVADENFLAEVLNDLKKREISSVFVEGGKHTLETFLKAGLWDEIRVIQSENNLGAGLRAPKLELEPSRSYAYGQDLIHEYRNA